MSNTLDRQQIEGILPHRDPFLFVDDVAEIEPGKRILGRWHVYETSRFLSAPDDSGQRHLPQTILAESMAQVGAILVLYPEENRGRTIYFRSIEDARFESPVVAGSTLFIRASVRRMKARFGSLDVTASIGSDGNAASRENAAIAASAVMSFALG